MRQSLFLLVALLPPCACLRAQSAPPAQLEKAPEAAAAPVPAAPAPSIPPRVGPDTVERFDGSSLAGWIGNPEWWVARDAGYTAKASGKVPTTFLLTDKNYSDFRITLMSRVVESTNHAGICLWGERNITDNNAWGYKGLLVIFPGLGMWDYNLNQGIKVDPAGKDLAKKVTSQNEWIRVEVLAQGNRIRAAYNGVQVLDWREPNPERLKVGPIGLQLHGFSQPQEVIYKDVVIESFPRDDRLITVKEQP
jgi:hypothetical protein